VETVGNLASVFSVGLIPSSTLTGRLTLKVEISTRGKVIFNGVYPGETQTIAGSILANSTDPMAKDFTFSVTPLINQFLVDVERDGALEK
jgi:hypothetical protein